MYTCNSINHNRLINPQNDANCTCVKALTFKKEQYNVFMCIEHIKPVTML